ncbi:glycosyltransferase [Secundilactobacillus collinoides]|uniref:glycosyltransferase n=1 Tax=Secundilactobacillus collinoides TaxID=33960 RepID=UPI000A6C1228|nr:glycosyltransferase [Secundilactobacillus collinoides]
MNIGLFTDTYFPQVSGVATSIKILKHELEKQGHRVYIFTTTDPHIERDVYERNIFRFPSVPFVSFTDRRIAFRGLFHAYQIAKELDLDIIHTQTEFSMGGSVSLLRGTSRFRVCIPTTPCMRITCITWLTARFLNRST